MTGLSNRPVFALALLIIAVIAGCVSQERLYQDIQTSRRVALRQWQRQRQLQQRSQTHISGALSLEDALKLALVNNKTLQQTAQENQIGRGEVVKSYSAIFPSVDVTADYTRLDEVSSFDVPGGTVQLGDVDNYSVNLTVTQPFFAGGAIGARLNAARLFRLFANQAVRSAVQDVIAQVASGYYDVLLNQHLFEISSDAVRSAKASLEAVEQKRAVGVASDFDVLRAQVELSNFKAELIKNRNAISVSKIELLKSMGVSQDSEVVLSDELEYKALTVPLAEAVRLAYENRPDLYQREIDVKSQQEALRIAQSRYWPTINGFYTNVWAKPDPKTSTIIEWGRAWRFGVVATMPVFDGFGREGAVIQEKARLRQAQISLIDTEETALAELRRAILSIEDAAEFVESQRLNLGRAEEGLRLAEVGFREGINTQVEVLDARSALTRARSLYYEAIYSHNIAKLSLQQAMGTLGPSGAVLSEAKLQGAQSEELDDLAERSKREVSEQ